MTTPTERLCSRSWRLRNSLWMAPAILLAGIATWASFLYIGVKAKRRSWLIASALYGIAMIAIFLTSSAVSDGSKETSSGNETVGGLFIVAIWLGGIVHAAVTNREWLRWKAHAGTTAAWYAQGAEGADERIAEPATSVDDVLLGTASGLAPAVLAPPPPVPPAAQAIAVPPPPPPPVAASHGEAPVDLNAASVADLEARLGLPKTVAERVVAERARLGGFTAMEQLLTEVGIEPHTYARIRDASAVGSTQGSTAAPLRGRRLEL